MHFFEKHKEKDILLFEKLLDEAGLVRPVSKEIIKDSICSQKSILEEVLKDAEIPGNKK
jgi:hypothetical protein